MGVKDGCKRRLEATLISDSLHLYGWGIVSGKSQGILKSDYLRYDGNQEVDVYTIF